MSSFHDGSTAMASVLVAALFVVRCVRQLQIFFEIFFSMLNKKVHFMSDIPS